MRAGQFITDLLRVTGGDRSREFEGARDHTITRMLTEGVRRTELIQQQMTDLPVDVIAQPFVRVVPLKGARGFTKGRIVPLVARYGPGDRHLPAGPAGAPAGRVSSAVAEDAQLGAITGSGLYRMLQRRAEEAGMTRRCTRTSSGTPSPTPLK